MQDDKNINCSIFKKNEPEMKILTDRINKTGDVSQKIKFAEELLEKADELLNCPQYDKKNIECENCRTISFVRKQTAELVIKMKKLI